MLDQREQRRRAVDTEVRTAALDLMTERGFDGVTVEEIAARTSVSASTIYRHFGTKEALVLTPGRPASVVARFADDTKRDRARAIRRAVNRVYGKDDAVLGELRLLAVNAGLVDRFRHELADAAEPLAAELARRDGDSAPTLRHRATAAATLAAVTVALLEWATSGGGKLGPHLDEALAAVV